MTTTMMHFGPEWMRTKGSARPAPSPPLTTSPAPPGSSTYSALVTPVIHSAPERRDVSNPFKYSKEELLRIYREGGGKGGLGLEVERWEGIVRELGQDPVGLKEMSDAEKKIFASSLNSEIRRRQSTDVLPASLGDRSKPGHPASAAAGPMRDRIGSLMARRRDSADQPPSTLPRKLSLSSAQGALGSPRDAAMPSPRTRLGITPGFDGVLSDSWSSRRRMSESMTKPHGDTRRDREPSDSGNEAREPDLKEEDEFHGGQSVDLGDGQQPREGKHNSQNDPGQGGGTVGNGTDYSMDRMNGSMASLSIGDTGSSNGSVPVGIDVGAKVAAPAPPSPTDLASIEWSYLDPQGQVQGPFRADIMQRWHDEGYFSADLLMKRAHLDTDWTSVGEMVRRAAGNPIFLTPGVTTIVPPGLPRRPDPLLTGPSADRERDSPFRPLHGGPLRSTTLDPYLHNGSSTSASPSSSFGAGRFVNSSPEPNAFEARATNHLYGDAPVGPRLAGLTGISAAPVPIAPQRRPMFNDPFDSSSSLRSPFVGVSNGRLDGLGFNVAIDGQTPSQNSAAPFSNTFATSEVSTANGSMRLPRDSPIGNGHVGPSDSAVDYRSFGNLNGQPPMSHTVNRDVFNRPAPDDTSPGAFGSTTLDGTPFHPAGQQFPQDQSLHYGSTPLNGRSFNSLAPIPDRINTAAAQSIGLSQQIDQSFTSSPSYTPSNTRWLPQGSPVPRRPGPFDPNYPTASNTVVTGQSTVPQPVYTRTQSTSSNEPSPWSATSYQAPTGGGWGSSSLTTANLGQFNQQQQQEERQADDLTNEPPVAQTREVAIAPQETASATEEVPSSAVAPVVEVARSDQKPRRKCTAQTAAIVAPPAQKLAPSPATVVKPSSPTPVLEPKLAWATDDDSKKSKPAGTALGLREIQEAEMKKLEARKTAERERERAARAVAAATAVSSQAEDVQPFTTSWGLPTSQAGTARPTIVTKESPALATTPTTPVWTNAAKSPVAKKTMKEIQEEEEKRKKQTAKEKETIAAATKRGYAETMHKSTPPPQPSGGAWTTVGQGGKAATVAVPARPAASTVAVTKTVPGAVVATIAASTTSARPTAAAVTSSRPAVPSRAVSSKVDDFPAPPSQDFMKWLGDSLKGLNNSINFEEITSMLLSFPLDPDQSTVEIISDLIYASSTTLDGRRFASEFVSRRKVDAASRPKNGVPVGSGSKTVSIADVVKTQPKPAQSEWGGFKVVNKKKRGTRA